FRQLTESLDGTARVLPVGDVGLFGHARKLQDADGRRRVHQSECNCNGVLSAWFIVVGKDDDMPTPDVLLPFRVERAVAGSARVAGRHPRPSFEGADVLFPFGKIDYVGIE